MKKPNHKSPHKQLFRVRTRPYKIKTYESRKEHKPICPDCFEDSPDIVILLRPGFYNCRKCNNNFIGEDIIE